MDSLECLTGSAYLGNDTDEMDDSRTTHHRCGKLLRRVIGDTACHIGNAATAFGGTTYQTGYLMPSGQQRGDGMPTDETARTSDKDAHRD